MGDNQTQGSADFRQLGSKIGSDLLGQYNKGFAVYPRDLNAGIGRRTRTALDDLWKTAGQNNNIDEATTFGNTLLRGTGLTPGQTAAGRTLGGIGNTFGGMAGGLAGPSWAETALKGAAGSALDPSLYEANLMDTASGKNLGGANPWFREALDNAAQDTGDDLKMAFGASGRFGGSPHAETASRELGKLRTGAMNQNYETERDRQLQALGLIEGGRQQGRDNRYRAVTAADMARLNQINTRTGLLDRQSGTARDSFGMEQQGIANRQWAAGMAPGLQQAALNRAQTRLGVGQYYDADAQKELTARNDLFRRRNDAGYDSIARILGLAGGAGGLPGIAQETPWWQSLLGELGSLLK